MREENQADIEFSESDDISILNLDVGQFYKDIEIYLKTQRNKRKFLQEQ